MDTGEKMSYVSVILAVVFWMLTAKQSTEAKKTLNEIKDAVITWQSELNKVSIDILSSRPEVIAKKTAFEEAKAKAEFSIEMSKIIKELSQNPSSLEDGGGYKLSVIDKILEHNRSLIIEREKIMAQAASGIRNIASGNKEKST